MAQFQPFRGIRYDLTRVELAEVVSPPYDVIDPAQREELAARSDHNAVRIDMPVAEPGRSGQAGETGQSAEPGSENPYELAGRLLQDWQAEGVLVTDERPTFTVHRMSYVDDSGVARHTTGVIGALELSPPGTDILPHEQTTPKAKTDRLDLLRHARANTSAIWGLSLAKGLTDLLPVESEPVADFADDDGVRHTVWVTGDPARCAPIAQAVADQPVVIADGHHRYETSLAYRAEREAAGGDAGEAAATLAYVVELVEDELTVRAIHRLVTGLPEGVDLVMALAPWFDRVGPPPAGTPVTAAMEEAGALCVIQASGEMLLRPRHEALADVRDLDSARLDAALAGVAGKLGRPTLTFQHGPDNVRRAVASGDAQAGVLLRPAAVAQIEATAHGGERMPPKTTFFHPKPKTGLVFRSLG